MMSPIAQLMLILASNVPEKKKQELLPGYRVKCQLCNEMGKDARKPCEGHDMAATE